MNYPTEEEWAFYEANGYLKLDRRLSGKELKALQDEIDAIMLGRAGVDYDRLMMQLDSATGLYGDTGEQTKGFKKSTLNYRKIQDLEFDPVFLEYLQQPLFRDICGRVYGKETPISAFRAMFMNKPAKRGTWLPWHQDRWKVLTKDPLLTVWTALDPSTKENGCVQIIHGSHRGGLINPEHASGFLTKEQAGRQCPEEKRVFLEMEAGEVALLHNHLLHASDVNQSDQSRRAFSVCYMEADTVDTRKGTRFPVVFGEGALSPEKLGECRAV